MSNTENPIGLPGVRQVEGSVVTSDSSLAVWIETKLRILRISHILVLALVARLAAIFVLRNFRHPILHEWGVIAHNLLVGNGFSYYHVGQRLFPSAFMPPAYATFVFFLFRLFGETNVAGFVVGQLVQAAAGVLLVYLVYRITEIYWSTQIALFSALLAALYPVFIYMPSQMSAINLYIVVDSALFYMISKYTEIQPRTKYIVLAGLLMGLLILFRAEALGLLFLLTAFMVFRTRGRRLLHATLFVLLAICVILPWTIRNWEVFHRVLPVTTAGPVVLWFGHNPVATGSMWHGPPDFKAIVPSKEMQAEIDGLPLTNQYEILNHRIYLEHALAFIRTHPRRELMLAGRKLLYFWTIDPYYQRARDPEYWIPAMLLVGFFWVGVISRWRLLASRYLLFSLYILFTMALSVVFIDLPRYRIGVEPFMIPFAALGFLWTCQLLPGPGTREQD